MNETMNQLTVRDPRSERARNRIEADDTPDWDRAVSDPKPVAETRTDRHERIGQTPIALVEDDQ